MLTFIAYLVLKVFKYRTKKGNDARREGEQRNYRNHRVRRCAFRASLREASDETCPRVIVVPTEWDRFPPDSGVRRDVVGAVVTNDSKAARRLGKQEAGRLRRRFHD